MRFTVVATGQFSLDRAFGFGLTASSLTQLSVVNSPIRPAGLAPAWPPASPAHTRKPKQKRERARPGRCFPRLAENRGSFKKVPDQQIGWRRAKCGTRGASRHARGGRAPQLRNFGKGRWKNTFHRPLRDEFILFTDTSHFVAG